jgi:hypothetical protein
MTLGSWINFEKLEDSLTLNELIELDRAVVRRDWKLQRMIGATFGADLPEDPFESSESEVTVEKIHDRALGKVSGVEDIYNDIADVRGIAAAQQGFGVGFGLGYEVE